jgi:hypothetical protein
LLGVKKAPTTSWNGAQIATACGLDKTLKPGAVGEEVARAAVVKLLKKLTGYAGGDYGLKDSGFLLRAAFALTNFGEDNHQEGAHFQCHFL